MQKKFIEVNDDFYEQKEYVENILSELNYFREKKVNINTSTNKFSIKYGKKY